MRASRLLSMLMLLQARGRMSAPALAGELGVTVRTVYRDMDQLSAAGVPVVAERGAAGGFALLDGWRTRLTGLTPDETQAVFLSGLRGPAAQLGLGEAMTSAQLKLLAALPAGGQTDPRRVGSRFHFDPVGWYQTAAPVDHLREIARAVWEDQRLRIGYESWKGMVDRTIEPLGLVLKGGEWYLVARVGRDLRTYRLSNVRALTVTRERFLRPKTFDLERYWVASIERFEAGLYRGTAVVRATDRGLTRLRGLSAAVADAVGRTTQKRDRAGRTRVTIPIESIDQAARDLLVLGGEGEVIEPPELRARIAESIGAMARLYASRPAHTVAGVTTRRADNVESSRPTARSRR
jgi:predicted DNA-binding transcriptional regulator YafY